MKLLLNDLSVNQKLIIELKYFQSCSDKEIASLLNTSRQAVNQTSNRAIRSLRTKLCIERRNISA